MLTKYYWFDREIVKSRKCGSDGNILGAHLYNPLIDTHVYKVEFYDDTTNDYANNIIAENLYSKNNPENKEVIILKNMIYNRFTDKSMPLSFAYEGNAKRHN